MAVQVIDAVDARYLSGYRPFGSKSDWCLLPGCSAMLLEALTYCLFLATGIVSSQWVYYVEAWRKSHEATVDSHRLSVESQVGGPS